MVAEQRPRLVEPEAPRGRGPGRGPTGIVITSPVNGDTLAPEAPPLVLVEGRVDDPIPAISLIANERRFAARVHHGRFRHVLPVFAPVLRLWAELPANGEPPRRSEAVTIQAGAARPPVGVVVVDWPSAPGPGVGAEVRAVWRERPDQPDAAPQTVPLRALRSDAARGPTEAFYLSPIRPGVYTFVLRYRDGAVSARVQPTLYLAVGTELHAHDLEPVTLDGSGQIVLARVLLPHGVRWEQDEWFTGQSATADAVTKFRFPEGVTWTERRSRLRPGSRSPGQ
jgi:hypothetical protein